MLFFVFITKLFLNRFSLMMMLASWTSIEIIILLISTNFTILITGKFGQLITDIHYLCVLN